MKFKIQSTLLFLTVSVLSGSLFLSCNDNDTSISGTDYIKFTYNNEERSYKFIDSTFQRCELHIGQNDKFIFSYDETFKSMDKEFYSLTVDLDCSSAHCPTTAIDESCQISFDLAKQHSNKKYSDYTSNSNINLVWSQKYDEKKNVIVVTGQFEGWLYQYYLTRPTGGEATPEPILLDSVHVEKGEFQVTTHY
ncbi:MAG TPA: hypothetical protein VIM65_06465 [Cyclobacteriaceae bacterium]